MQSVGRLAPVCVSVPSLALFFQTLTVALSSDSQRSETEGAGHWGNRRPLHNLDTGQEGQEGPRSGE